MLGSGPDCALRVQEAGVQPHHAVVKALKDQGFGLKALAAGVRVNGAAVEATPLKDGDVIELGTTRIAFGQVQKRGLPQITGYRILGELGRGGMGNVYRAEQTSLHREVALKVLNRELTKDPAFVAKFVAEARAAAKLQHPNVVQVFDVDQDGETYFYAMELMHDGSLEDWLKQHGAMPVERALRVVSDAASGLAYAESLGIVHRDIKPDNLMLDQHGAVKIADLGLAGTVEDTEENAIGTPHFMAPEQVLKKDIDHRTDLYALGCTFYRLVTGKTPFRGQTVKDILRAQVKDDAEPAHKQNSAVPSEVSAIIQKLMAKDPGQRYQTANDLLEELGLLLQPPAKKGLWIGLAAAAALVAGGAIYWAVTKPVEKSTEYIKYDDPEKQQFADELKVLKKAALEDKATIAVLQTRVSALAGTALADALERVANEYATSKAAAEARQLATQLREEVTAAARKQEQQRTRVTSYLATLGQSLQANEAVGDYANALKPLDVPHPAELRDDAELLQGVQKLREQVLGKARTELQTLQAAIDAASGKQDETELKRCIAALTTALDTTARWPAALQEDLARARTAVTTANTTLGNLTSARGAADWQQHKQLLAGANGVRASLDSHDLPGALAATQKFAATAGTTPAATAASELAAAIAHADSFAQALEKAAAGGQLQLTNSQGPTLQVVRWDRANKQLVLADPTKKPLKEQTQPSTALTIELWTQLAEQVAPPMPGSRECFLGMLALSAHASAAQSFLQRVRADDDSSGTGTAGYPLSASVFDGLLRHLPEDPAPWSKAIRSELQAGLCLAAGLRALSERRNLAAATQLEKLCSEHPHSLLVAVLP